MDCPGRAIFHGALRGIVAGAVVAAWLFAVDMIAGEPFYTAGRLPATVLGDPPFSP